MKKEILLYVLFFLTAVFPNASFSQANRHWATYYGGTGDEARITIVTDAFGNVFQGGYTSSASGIASGGFQNTYGGGKYDAYLVKFDASGNRLWATYYGGAGEEEGRSIATDAMGNVYLAGVTTSSSGIASGGFKNSFGGFYDAFLVKFDASGNRLWATYYGGAVYDEGWSVTTDASGNVYLAGITFNSSGIASGGFQNTFGGTWDAFLVKFNASGSRLWATYYGGAGQDGGYSVATDTIGNVYMEGYTNSTSKIASGGYQNTYGGGTRDAFLVKFDASGKRLWATYYGGSGAEEGYSVATDVSGNAYLTGRSNSIAGISSGGFQNTIGGRNDAYLVKFDASGKRLWATYYGGAGSETGCSVVASASGNIYLAGSTSSSSGIALGGFQNTYAGGGDAFLVNFDAEGNRLCATYYGGTGADAGGLTENVAMDILGNIYLAGTTKSLSGISSGGFKNTYAGGLDAFIVKFSSCCNMVVSHSSTDVNCKGQCTGAAAAIQVGGTKPYLYSWNTVPPQEKDTAEGLCAGTYVVTVTDSNKCVDTAIVIIAEPLTALSDIVTNTNETCNGGNNAMAVVTATGGTGPYVYLWSNGAIIDTISNLVAGTYQITVTDSLMCSVTDFAVVVEPSVLSLITNITDADCDNLLGEASVNATGGTLPYSYLWNDSLLQDSSVAVKLSAGTYQVTVTDSNGCIAVSDNMVITNIQLPGASFTMTPHEGDEPLEVVFTDNSTGAKTYQWDFGETLSLPSVVDNPIHIYTTAGTYTVKLTVTGIHGCADDTFLIVTVNPKSALWIPNSYTPDGDGMNDVFNVKSAGLKELDAMIFDRWGELIYEWDITGQGWDGRYKGKNVQEGVYVYVVKAIGIDKVFYNKTGHVTLLRK